MKRIQRFIRESYGQSLVEFALVLPLLMMLMLGIFEFGRLWMTMNVMTSAAREGVRVAAVTAPNVSQAQTAARNVLTSGQVTGAAISVSGPNSASEVTVTVQINYSPLTAGLIPGLGPRVLSQTATMHWEH